MDIKALLKKNPVIHAVGSELKARAGDIRPLMDHLAERRIHRSGPIRVGFLCQYLPAWTKCTAVYEAMQKDPRFDPVLLCVPDGLQDCNPSDPACPNNTYSYFLSHGYPEAVNTLSPDGTWLDLKTLDLSYVFYNRPYNHLLPACYSATRLRRYTRVCLLLYGMTMTAEILETMLNRDFMRSVFCFFAETEYSLSENRQRNRLLHKLGLQHSVRRGVPVLFYLNGQKDQPSPSWDFSKNAFRAIWTPRWTSSKAGGGTNFFAYYQKLLDYAEEHPDMDLLLRPHPLALPNFLRTGELTQQQLEDYHRRCDLLDNVAFDPQSQYESTFWHSNVLISDLSSITPEYFFTGKPIIFCASNMELHLGECFRRMLFTGCYVANNAQELFGYLDQLRRGEDPLKEVRAELIRELFGTVEDHAPQRILDTLAEYSAGQS